MGKGPAFPVMPNDGGDTMLVYLSLVDEKHNNSAFTTCWYNNEKEEFTSFGIQPIVQMTPLANVLNLSIRLSRNTYRILFDIMLDTTETYIKEHMPKVAPNAMFYCCFKRTECEYVFRGEKMCLKVVDRKKFPSKAQIDVHETPFVLVIQDDVFGTRATVLRLYNYKTGKMRTSPIGCENIGPAPAA